VLDLDLFYRNACKNTNIAKSQPIPTNCLFVVSCWPLLRPQTTFVIWTAKKSLVHITCTSAWYV